MYILDVVIFGATGFTGKEVVIEITKIAKKHNLTWAVAGRSEKKLQVVMQEVALKTGEDVSSVTLIKADVSDESSLKDMCSQAKVVINCCGPFGVYGEPVVKAAIECKTSYLDISGEPLFIELMQLKYDKLASEAGVYVVSACGFDSVPNDLGVVFAQQQFNGVLNSLESYMSWTLPQAYQEEIRDRGIFNVGTWDSFIQGAAELGEEGRIHRQLYPKELPSFNPKLKSRFPLHKKDDEWCVPFLGVDGPIVYRTQRYLYEYNQQRFVQFKPYVKLGSFWNTFVLLLTAGLILVMSKFNWTKQKLLNNPKKYSRGYVTKEGPTDEVMKNISFKVEMYGEGWGKGDDMNKKPTKKITVRVTGNNPGYGATVAAISYCALAILTEKEKMPPTGGVMTTGVAFGNTSLIKNLYDNNMKFEVINNK